MFFEALFTMNELVNLQSQLNSIITSNEYLNSNTNQQILNIIEQINNIDITRDMLISTKVALVINKIKKIMNNPEIQEKATELFTKMHAIMKQTNHQPKLITTTDLEEIERSRDKHRQLIYNQLRKHTSTESKLDPKKIADQIEEELNKSSETKEQFGFLINALSDPKINAEFLISHKLLPGKMTPIEFIQLTKDDLMNDSEKAYLKKIKEDGMKRAMVPQPIASISPFFQCPSCGSKNIFSRQYQIKASDEPITNLCICQDCCRRWSEE